MNSNVPRRVPAVPEVLLYLLFSLVLPYNLLTTSPKTTTNTTETQKVKKLSEVKVLFFVFDQVANLQGTPSHLALSLTYPPESLVSQILLVLLIIPIYRIFPELSPAAQTDAIPPLRTKLGKVD